MFWIKSVVTEVKEFIYPSPTPLVLATQCKFLESFAIINFAKAFPGNFSLLLNTPTCTSFVWKIWKKQSDRSSSRLFWSNDACEWRQTWCHSRLLINHRANTITTCKTAISCCSNMFFLYQSESIFIHVFMFGFYFRGAACPRSFSTRNEVVAIYMFWDSISVFRGEANGKPTDDEV